MWPRVGYFAQNDLKQKWNVFKINANYYYYYYYIFIFFYNLFICDVSWDPQQALKMNFFQENFYFQGFNWVLDQWLPKKRISLKEDSNWLDILKPRFIQQHDIHYFTEWIPWTWPRAYFILSNVKLLRTIFQMIQRVISQYLPRQKGEI